MDSNQTTGVTDLSDVPYVAACGFPTSNYSHVDPSNVPTKYVELLCYPALLLLCTIGNSLNLLVLGVSNKKSTTTVYLMCLAVSDLFVLWLELPNYILAVNPDIIYEDSYYIPYTNFLGLRTWWSETCIQFSDWTLIVFSIERLLAITRPLELRSHNMQTTICIQVLVFLLASITTVENAVMWYYVILHDDGVRTKYEIAPPGLLMWDRVQQQAEVGITIAKFLFLVIINFGIVVALARQAAVRSVVLHKSAATNPNEKRHHRTSNLFLFACVSIYFASQFPNVTMKILEIASMPPFCSFLLSDYTRVAARPLIYICLLSNYSLNFFFYCTLCKKFRIQLKSLCDRMRTFNERRRSSSGATRISSLIVLISARSSVNSCRGDHRLLSLSSGSECSPRNSLANSDSLLTPLSDILLASPKEDFRLASELV